ncbi:hypothetical protein GCM10010168_45420 [Actinoplanes ianthinogenes]|uniref:Enediyne biosynthesis protein n=1 Tax=Actinoplanes ianthinogenes TaxID=122358 RepID=A0ABM7LPN0_9ACTN|nr:DUF1702 family protein [Actinoplanes ianthinogenes]BCJ41160.1 hypothetical protein Aiant_18170 [Actinoplanes ianthinogenes]GGR22493.1 hypothetical protein GCM10010168_45420 [Actinoplanes ianthinogenes]
MSILGALRRLVLAPALRSVTFSSRGFPVAPTAATQRMEAIPQSVICGFEWGIEARDRWELERRLELVEPEMRGFAYEGAAMACTVRDVMAGGRGHRSRDLLSGPGVPHTFLTYIGVGFAMARLPRIAWKQVLPDLTGTPYYPTMSWLAVDGYGFDLAYFHTREYVDQQRIPPPYPWLGRPDYFPRAVDQGIGRALWFIHGGGVAAVGVAVGRFAPERRADLWSGVGLAATFAGGAGADDLATLRDLAGEHWPHLAQGALFAAKARAFAGYTPPQTEAGTTALAGLPVAEAVRLADEVTGDGLTPAPGDYEDWRAGIRERLVARNSVPAAQ